MGAYFEMFRRDMSRLQTSQENEYLSARFRSTAGTTYPLDRAYTAELLGFDGPT